MRFLKRLCACLKHYPLPQVVVWGGRCELTGPFAYNSTIDDIEFEVAFHFGMSRSVRFIASQLISEVETCRS